jgi:hypothetical protein
MRAGAEVLGMCRALFALLAISSAAPAAAQNLPTPPPGGVEIAPDGRVVMSSQICAAFRDELAVAGADYQEGVDVNGRRVAPADLPSSPDPLKLDNFPIEIKADLAGKFGVPAAGAGNYGAKAVIGYVTLRGNQAYFNGQPIGSDQRAALIEACRRAKR